VRILMITGNTNSVETFRAHMFPNSRLRCDFLLCLVNTECYSHDMWRHSQEKEKQMKFGGSQGSGHGSHCLPVCDAVCICFPLALSISQFIQRRMIGELERIWKEVVVN
jgi:hypothetical protein